MEIITSGIFTLLSLVAVFYGLAVYRWLRGRIGRAASVDEYTLRLARGAADAALRKLLMAVVGVLIGVLVGLRDLIEVLEDPQPFSWPSLGIRLLFILFILLVMDALRLQKQTYVRRLVREQAADTRDRDADLREGEADQRERDADKREREE